MNKLINGRRYDTDTARRVAEAMHGLPSDLDYICESLHRKTTGEYFLHGEGGAATKYAVSTGGNWWKGGERIIPLTLEEARAWAEEHLTADEVEEIFALKDGKKTVALSLDEETIERIRRGAAEVGVSMSEYVSRAVEGYK